METRNITYLAGVLAFGSTLVASGPAAAQEPAAARGTLDEIVTTARRVEESLQDTPISVTAFTADDLRDRMIISTEDLDQVTPNLQFTNDTTLAGNNNSSNIFIRGVGQTDPTATVDPGVGLYIDEVYMGQSIGGTMDFRDIRSVQILRGPQGTLFGKNSVGGAVVLTTNDPGEEFGGEVRMGAGSDSLFDVFMAVDAPLSDTLKSRFTIGKRVQDGYVTRVQTGEDLGDTDAWTATAKLLIEPNDRFRARLSFDYTRADENGNPFVFAASNESATFQVIASRDAGCPGATFPPPGIPVPDIDDDRCANDFQNKGPYKNNGTYELKSELDNRGLALHLDYDLSDTWTLTSITSHRSLEWTGIRDADNTPLTILHTSYDSDGYQLSQELQFQYASGNVNGTLGAFYFEEESDDIVHVQLNDPAPGVQEDSDNNLTENSSRALFTQWTFDATEALSLTLGGRYTEDTKASTPDQYNYLNPDAKYLPVQKYEKTFDDFSMTASAAFALSEESMVYLSYAEAFKGGGWNSHFNTCQILEPCATELGLVPGTPPYNNAVAAAQAFAAGIHSFDTEEAATWEIGFKTDLLDNTLRLNGAIFTTDYDDLQFTYRSGVAPYLANAGKAGIDGAELELTWLPSEAWVVEGGIGYLDAQIDELKEFSVVSTGVEEGNRLPYTPELTLGLGIGYSTVTAGGWLVAPRVDYAYRDDTYWDANNTEEIAVDSDYSIIDASLAFGPDAGPWRARLAVKNLTDEVYSTGGNSSLSTGSGYAEIAYARPRQYFAMFEYDF
jgi:iron complex outermembrane receptor protein